MTEMSTLVFTGRDRGKVLCHIKRQGGRKVATENTNM